MLLYSIRLAAVEILDDCKVDDFIINISKTQII